MMSDALVVKAIESIRSAYKAAGSPNGPACTSETCGNLATRRVFWPVTPAEDFPLYCDDCAAWARTVLETLGVKYRDEELPAKPNAHATRQIRIDD